MSIGPGRREAEEAEDRAWRLAELDRREEELAAADAEAAKQAMRAEVPHSTLLKPFGIEFILFLAFSFPIHRRRVTFSWS
jgi:hypothetical protein